MRRRIVRGWLLACGVAAWSACAASALAQPRFKQIAEPAETVLAGAQRLPDPEELGVISASAMLPIEFDPRVDAAVRTARWRADLPIDEGRDVRFMLLAPDSDGWRLRITPPVGRAVALEPNLRAADIEVRAGHLTLSDGPRAAISYRFFDRPAGDWLVEVVADGPVRRGEAGPAGYLLVKSERPERLRTHFETHRLIEGREVGLTSRIVDVEGRPAASVIDEASMTVRTPAGESLVVPMKAGREGVSFRFTPEFVGTHTARVTVRGRHADGAAFVRTSQHVFSVVADEIDLGDRATLEPDRPGVRRVRLALARAERETPAIVAAELWGTDESGGWSPVCWLSGMAWPDREAGSVSLHLDERWLSVARVRAPFELRRVRVQCRETAVPLATAETIPLIPSAPLPAWREGLEVTPDMRTGRPRADLVGPRVSETVEARARAFAGHNLMLVHGYCSSGVWPVQNFTGGVEVFLDQNQNRSHDAFANLIWAFGNNSKSFGIVAHSQGGAAALHLWTYYFSGLDWAEGPRLIQSVGTPYQGTPLAGNLAVLGDLFGAGCGTNFDLSVDGAALWLAGIPASTRDEVHYWTTSFEDGFGFDYCNLVSDFFLSDPDDGVIERSRGQLPGANNMGHTEGWCHSQGMRDPAQFLDTLRNLNMNANAAR